MSSRLLTLQPPRFLAVEPVDSQPETATGTTEETLPVDEQQASDTATTTVPAVEPVDSQPETATGTTEDDNSDIYIVGIVGSAILAATAAYALRRRRFKDKQRT